MELQTKLNNSTYSVVVDVFGDVFEDSVSVLSQISNDLRTVQCELQMD